MKISRVIFPIVLLSFFFIVISCHKDDDLPIIVAQEEEEEEEENNMYEYDCVFKQIEGSEDGLIDSTEKFIMSECMANEFETISEIKENLIGNWELIGHGEGMMYNISQPCAFISVTEEKLTLEYTNLSLDTVVTFPWDIELVNWAGGQFFRLNVQQDYQEGLYLTHFSEQYMFGDGTPADGRMHLYEKVK